MRQLYDKPMKNYRVTLPEEMDAAVMAHAVKIARNGENPNKSDAIRDLIRIALEKTPKKSGKKA
jgi:Arc/MetJ-type ribon-helix-helix transcriptional regulator